MKKILFVVLLCTIIFKPASSQVIVNDVNINELPDVQYIQMVAIAKLLSVSKVTITVDYGQPYKMSEDTKISGVDKKPIVFNSNMDALNFLDKNGWEFVNSYPVTSAGGGSVYHYLLKRKEKK
jgi:hypothetical protein